MREFLDRTWGDRIDPFPGTLDGGITEWDGRWSYMGADLGPTSNPVDEDAHPYPFAEMPDHVRIANTMRQQGPIGGSYKLVWQGGETPPIPHDVTVVDHTYLDAVLQELAG